MQCEYTHKLILVLTENFNFHSYFMIVIFNKKISKLFKTSSIDDSLVVFFFIHIILFHSIVVITISI